MLARMVGSEDAEKAAPVKKVGDTTQPGLPLGDNDDVPTDEHAALGDSDADTDEHAAVKEQPTTDPSASTG